MDTTGDELYDADPDADADDDDDEDVTIRAEPQPELEDEEVDDDDTPEVADDGEDEEDDGSETDEETTIQLRDKVEREEIESEFAELIAAVPRIAQEYALLDRLGTGTFSSVYKARDLRQAEYDNSLWITPDIRNSEFVAIKRIYVTSSPDRISNEIFILAEVAGCRNVAQLITAFRERDQVVAVMPYHRNVDFRTYYQKLPIVGIQSYFRCLFRALRDIHARGIVHRDVKPANFLFDPRSGNGVLVDFGLAMHVSSQSSTGCNHSSPTAEFPHGRFLDLEDTWQHTLRRARREARARKALPSDKVGYPADDHRPVSKANRAGTRGFRAPEVLLKCDDQSGAIDVWAAGTVLMFFLTQRFPLYSASDDVEALMELAAIIGYKAMERVAILHNRTFLTNVPMSDEGIPWREFAILLNPSLDDPDGEPERSEALEDALDFVEKCLEPQAPTRMTAREALYHPFLREDGAEYTLEEDDDELCVRPPGDGICGHLHRRDEVTGEWCVIVRGEGDQERVVQLAVGEGLCVGREPCSFHADLFPAPAVEE
ncbi:kinase-like protein [Exidia glandulosa HHB12029]|uniref:non-specific serine/threonine protein kinase n=1 Tax=Exidia glandulosa HHB12029 TaxID=1314781 RepID=A0A165ENS4_EXIGL|nr:kinase-like protein [Exidia glandulosa HHB12029]